MTLQPVTPEWIAAARRGLDMSTYEFGLALGLAYTNPNPEDRRKYAGNTVQRWEREGAAPWARLAIRCLYYDRKIKPPE
jgi:hypothetical protein